MQSQTAFYYIGQVLTVDLCFRHARLVLNLVHLVKVVFILTIVFPLVSVIAWDLKFDKMKVLKCVHVHTLLKVLLLFCILWQVYGTLNPKPEQK